MENTRPHIKERADDDLLLHDAVRRGCRTAVFCFAWIGLLGAAFTVPDQCRAEQPPSAGRDILRVPIVEGRDIRFRRLSDPQNLSEVRVDSIVQDKSRFGVVRHGGTRLNRYDGYNALFKDHSGNLWYAERHFNVRVRDDGIGIDASSGQPGRAPGTLWPCGACANAQRVLADNRKYGASTRSARK